MSFQNNIIAATLLFIGCASDTLHFVEPVENIGHKTDEDGYYVSPSGDNANPCTKENPCRDILYVSSFMEGGDTLYVRGGEYHENEIWLRFDHQTAPNKYLVIKAYKGEIPVYSNGDRPMIVEMPYVKIEGLHFTNGKSINAVKGCDGVQIVGNKFYGSGYAWAAISVEGSDVAIYNNEINLNGNTVGTLGHGIYAAQGRNIEIMGNRVSGMSGYGIHVFDQRRSGDTEPRQIENVTIAYNTCFNSRERAGIIVAAQSPDAAARNIRIYRNIVYDHPGNGITVIDAVSNVIVHNNTVYNINTNGIRADGEDGIYIGRNVDNVKVLNNIIWHEGAGHHIAVENATNVSGSNNMYWPDMRLLDFVDSKPFVADPLFRDISKRDFYLLENSPAIDKGTNIGIPYWGNAVDLGATEHKPSGLGVR